MNEVRHVPVVDHICIGNTPFVYTILSSCRLLVQLPYIVSYLFVITELKGNILADFCLTCFVFLLDCAIRKRYYASRLTSMHVSEIPLTVTKVYHHGFIWIVYLLAMMS